ncbi:hypothetical protein LG198_05015 [Methylobacillus arboreus]|uniref:hypothetical protein n=1 Tax=Methylobacillus arboreus TaxID=755170 RepID=UPI001E633ADD|nr:hypothetical protein [Methylobacillus arboreus]MCB5190083.1 hypothetical protein [Methylobacillus arboreus]
MITLTRADWARLGLPIAALLVAVVFTALITGYARSYRDEVSQKLSQQETQLMQARSRLQSSGLERENIIRYLPVYQRLISQGFIGEEHRIEWVDALRNIHQAQRLFGIKYSIGAQALYTPAFIANTAPFGLYRSVMKLELPLLHEGDLLVLLDGLKNAQTTPFLLRECSINRVGTVVPDRLVPTANAACELDWLTLRESSSGGAP